MLRKLSDILLYNNSKPVEFILKNKFSLLKENDEYIPKSTEAGVPRFTIKNITGVGDIPINKPIPATEELMTAAIKYGLIFLVQYKGKKDNHTSGHSRVIYPMVMGRSAEGKILLRVYHLKGWSVSNNREVELIWRMFRLDRIKSVIFTGSFYRLPPKGYNPNDKGMRGGVLVRANFDEIRKNQQGLLKLQEIQNRKDIELDSEDENEIIDIKVKSTDTTLDILKPFENAYIENEQTAANLRITFLKSLFGNKYIAIIGALGRPGNVVKIKNEKDVSLGSFKSLDAVSGEVLKRIKKVKGNNVFDLYIFDKKLN